MLSDIRQTGHDTSLVSEVGVVRSASAVHRDIDLQQ